MIYKVKEKKEEKEVNVNHPRYGTHHSEESKKKISESMKGKTNNKGKHWKWKKNQEKQC